MIRIAFFTNLEELSRYLKNRNDEAANLAKLNETKDNVNFESITNGATNLASDQDKASDNKGLEILNTWSDQANDQASDQAVQIIERNLNDKVLSILKVLEEPKKRVEILEHIGLRNHSDNREKYLDPMVKLGWIEMTIPDKPTHKDQKYKRTIQGEILHKLITR